MFAVGLLLSKQSVHSSRCHARCSAECGCNTSEYGNQNLDNRADKLAFSFGHNVTSFRADGE